MNTSKLLENLGLAKNEATVYLALLKCGLTQAGPLVKTTKLHRMLVYNALNRLVDEGLATVIHKKSVQLFQPTDPGVLLEKTKKLSLEAEVVVPELRKLQQQLSDVVNVRTLVGNEGFQTNLTEMIESCALQAKKEMCIIGGAPDVDFYEAVGEWYPTYVHLLEAHRVKKRLIAPESYSHEFQKKFIAEKFAELRIVPTGLSSPTYTRINQEMVSIEMYHPQIVVIQIRNKPIAKSYLDSFELLWKTAKPV